MNAPVTHISYLKHLLLQSGADTVYLLNMNEKLQTKKLIGANAGNGLKVHTYNTQVIKI